MIRFLGCWQDEDMTAGTSDDPPDFGRVGREEEVLGVVASVVGDGDVDAALDWAG